MKKTAVLLSVLALTLTACGGESGQSTPVPTVAPTATVAPTPTPTPEPEPTLVWEDQVTSQEFTADDGTVVMTARSVMPGIAQADTNPVWLAIHAYYTGQSTAVQMAATENADWAKDEYQIAKTSGYDFTPHAQEYSYAVTYQSDALVSICREGYSFTGGAYPFSFRLSETFDLTTGAQLELADLFVSDWETPLLALLSAQNTASDYAEMVTDEALTTHFGTADFYLSEEGLVLYYPEGILGPHALGTPSYTLAYSDLGDILALSL